MKDPWPHQINGVDWTIEAHIAGIRRLCLTSPTGSGKTWMVEKIIDWFLKRGEGVILHSNRKMLIEQLDNDFAHIIHGVRAAGYDADLHDRPLQLSSVQSEISRTLKRKTWSLHQCKLAIFDEGHLQTEGQVLDLRKLYLDAGATTLDVTATPLGMGGVCDKLIVAGNSSDCRRCGALVSAEVFGPDEPDLREFKRDKNAPKDNGEDLSANQLKKVYPMTPQLFGRVWNWYEQLNPDRRPTLLFGPGVEESIWFAKQFSDKGVRAAHIDGEDIWLDGELHRANPDLRSEILRESESGRIGVICNRFVLREGINAPWLAHGILATIFGSLQSYLQSIGRLLRWHPSLASVTIQDHGGNFWRHGSPNADREWVLGDTADLAYKLRAKRIREGQEKAPFRCPNCARIWVASKVCSCGFVLVSKKTPRAVVTTDGTMKYLNGSTFPARRISGIPNGESLWQRMYYRAKSKKWNATFSQAFARFAEENEWGWPNPQWRLMPIEPRDEFRRITEVPLERLR